MFVVDDFDKKPKECRNYLEEMPVEEKNSGREQTLLTGGQGT
jgi:hypothetical protein